MSKSTPQSVSRPRFMLLIAAAIVGSIALLLTMMPERRVQAVGSSTIVISQVYGGGGNAGATLKNDFIELFNKGTSPVDLSTWSVQYASTTGTSWQRTNLTGTLQPGHYYLVQEAAGTGGTTNLPTPDATGTIAMALGAGKVALINNQTTIGTIACPTGATVVDFVGFGVGTNCFEGVGPTPTLSNTTAALRAGAGCTDTDSNSADFTAVAPNPRNTASSLNGCGNPLGTWAANPSSVLAGGTTLLTVTVTPGTGPTSTGLAVSANLTAIGGSASQQFFDNGTNGDVTPNDKIFSFQATVAANTTGGAKSLTATITDAQARSSSATISLNVLAPTPPTGVGAATPSTVQAGNQTKLTVTVTPGSNPTSSGLAVSGDLSSISGSATQQFFDDGTHGDVTSGDNVFTFQATVSAGTATGAKSLLTTVSDGQSRSSTASISLTVTAASTPPTGVGSATPGSLQTANSTLLKVNVTPGVNPVSTGIGVIGDLSSIGGSASQQFFDDATHGDVTAGDNIFSFQATVSASPGAKTLPITVSDGQARSSTTSISLTVLPPPPPTTIKVSQVYGGGGNSGSTYTNDFIEIYNQGPTTIDVSNWSVQYQSAGATGSWQVTALCVTPQPCTVAPGHYYLVQESLGAGGTTALPAADASGIIAMSGSAAKVALVNSTTSLVTPVTGGCPAPGAIADLVGYGGANCSETSPTATLSNTTAAVRRGNGCIDTDNNSSDFVTIGPIPRNSASPANSCGGDPSQPSGLGLASPSTLDPASNTLLSVVVTPATIPPSTGITVNADLTNIGGPGSQQFYDDATHGDVTAGDNTFSYQAIVGAATTTGAKSIVATITDAQARTATAPITLTVQSPTCGVERWSVKVGTDADVNLVDLNNPVRAFIPDLGAIPAPADPPGPPDNARLAPTETTVYVVNATLTLYKKEADVDYHMVLQDDSGHTIIAEIPNPACVVSSTSPRVLLPSPLAAGIANARAKFDARFNATTFFQTANIPVQVTGVGFFDFIHGQTGVAPNGIELHPVLDITFTANTSTTLVSSANPSQFGNSVDITATVTNGVVGSTPTGTVNFFEGSTALGSRTLDGSGHATFSTNTLSVGSHSITAHYEGDSTSATSTALALTQVVNKADQTINFGPLAGKTFGDPDFLVSATSSSGLPVSFSIVSGPATISGNTVHITGAGTVMVRASQTGDTNYNAAPDATQSFEVAKAGQMITFAALGDKTYGNAPFSVSATGGGSGNPVTFGASGNCTAGGTNGSTITITGAGSCTVTASETGNSDYDPAPDVSRSFTINQATASITVNDYSGVYDGNAHGVTGSATGVNGEDLSGLLNLGATFTDVPGGAAHWSFAGDANYATASGDATVTITKAAATINVTGYTGVYDGGAHGASGSATGVSGEPLSALLNFGATFINVPGGTAHWTFAGNTNYAPAGGDVSITIGKATPTITWSNPADIVYGTALSATQLDATANVGGSFNYTPASGAILIVGPGQPLLASFTPTDTTNYDPTSKSVMINVLKATPSFSNLSSPTIINGTPTTNLSGKISFGSFIPTGSVSITLNAVTQNASIQGSGNFSSNFATGSLAPINPPYSITYSYGGDSNFNPASGAGTLTVGYGILTLYDQGKVHQSGSTIPIKLGITDVNGNNLSSANTVVTAVGMALVSNSVYGPVEDSGNANPDNDFRFSGDSYIFNLKTTGLATGTYNLYFRVGADPTLHTVQFQIR